MDVYNSIAELAAILPFTHDEIMAAALFFFYAFDAVRAVLLGGIVYGVFRFLNFLFRKCKKQDPK